MFTDNKTELDKFDRKSSVLISGYLEGKGYGVLYRNANKHTILSMQLAEELVSFKFVPTGGIAEGSGLPEVLDSDSMGVIQGFHVSDDHDLLFSDCDENGVAYLCIKRNEQFPGFCKLQLSQKCYDRLQRRIHVMNTTKDVMQVIASVIKQGDDLLISSDLIKKKLNRTSFAPPEKFDDPLFVINGPAKTYSHLDLSTDVVDCFEFNKWPEEATMWKERRRKHNWPNSEVLDRLEEKVSCYVVPKGNKSSKDSAVEWSISFAEIERELMWNMNDTQFKCYICLKRLIKRIQMEEMNASLKTISTYQIKNIFFWMCEIIPEHEWRIENLFRYIRLGLMKLRNCVWLGYNAHYFIPGMNLWRSVRLSAPEKKTTMRILTIAIHSPNVYHLFQIHKTFTSDVNRQTILEMITFETRLVILIQLGSRCSDETLQQFYEEMLSRFPKADRLSTCLAITKAERSLRKLLNIQCINYQKVKTEVIAAELNDNINEIVEKVRAAYQCDYLTTSLYIAVVFNFFRRYADVQKELKPKLLNTSQKLYIYKDELYYFVPNSAKVYRVSEDVDLSCLSKDGQSFIPSCFYLPEEEILPFPLKLHAFLLQVSHPSVIPFVLAYYLLFTSQHHLGLTSELEATRKLLKSAVLNSKFHKFFFFHLYLLGYSFYITGDMKEAYYWFTQSAIQKPSRLNAALYQIAIMINDWIQLRKKYGFRDIAFHAFLQNLV